MVATFAKDSPLAPPGFFAAEAAGLRWLAEATAVGGPVVARVLAQTHTRLELERVMSARPDVAGAERFGRALATMHGTGITGTSAAGWGAAPPGSEIDADGNPVGYIGDLPLPLLPGPGSREVSGAASASALGEAPAVGQKETSGPASWAEFYAQYRVEPYLRLAADRGALDPDQVRVLDRFIVRLPALDHPQPAFGGPGAGIERRDESDAPNLPGSRQRAARIHGDLWAGNVIWAGDACPSGAVLIDPAAHGGHGETDLAMLALFGLAHLERVIAAYDEVAPLTEGHRARRELHQVHPLLVHAALFAGNYGRSAVTAASGYL